MSTERTEGPHKSTWQSVGSLAAARTLAEGWGVEAIRLTGYVENWGFGESCNDLEYAARCAGHFARMYLQMRNRKALLDA